MPRRRSRSSRRTSASACSPRASRRRFASRKRPSRECRSSSTIRTGWPPSPIAISRRRFSPMASGKRASMREGPLAALFRRTDEDAPEGADGTPQASAPEVTPEPQAAAPAPAAPAAPQAEATVPPVTPAAAARRREPDPLRDEGPAATAPPHPRETGYPHPSLGADPEPEAADAPRAPSAQERLRNA